MIDPVAVLQALIRIPSGAPLGPFCGPGPGTIGLSSTQDEAVAVEGLRRAARIDKTIAEEWLA